MNSGRCAACKYLRRRCRPDCIFAPYFPSNNLQRFATVHRIYGASNVGKMLQRISEQFRAAAADAMYFEAQCRIQKPIYGCVGIISQLHEQIQRTQLELAKVKAEIATFNSGLHVQSSNLYQDSMIGNITSFDSTVCGEGLDNFH